MPQNGFKSTIIEDVSLLDVDYWAVKVTLEDSEAPQLSLRFTQYSCKEPTIIVVNDILQECQSYVPYHGYVLSMDRTTLQVLYSKDLVDYEHLRTAQIRLDDRLNQAISQRQTMYRRDPQSLLVTAR